MSRISLKSMTPPRRVAVLGIGIALYVVLSLALQVPFFENYYLCLGYVVLAVYCYLYGSVAGAIVGTIGCLLHAMAINGLRGMPGWALGNLFIGLSLGSLFSLTLKHDQSAWRIALTTAGMVLITAIGILGIKSLTEVVLYGQPMWARVVKNSYAFVADCVVMVFAIPFCIASEKLSRSMMKGSATGQRDRAE